MALSVRDTARPSPTVPREHVRPDQPLSAEIAPEAGRDLLIMEFHVSSDLFRSPHAEGDVDDTGMRVREGDRGDEASW
ncbi:hypothetical protein GCM10010320_68530 [Streptomyces caelestis]|nr:hypothetical protein GCM10010320_68530 [Streptomyces caelestis]